MATPPGEHPYDGPRQQPLKRFNFPSAPSHRREPDAGPYADPAPRGPYADPLPQQSGPGPESYGYPGAGYQDPGVPQTPRPPRRPMPEPPAPQAPVPEQRAPAPRIEPHVPADDPGGTDGRSVPAGPDQQPLLRPYAMTGGRTRPRYQLAIEALVSTTADPERLGGRLPEHQRICHLCREVKSVAEVSALLSIPLGVARILVADLAEAGLVAIHQPGGDEAAGGQPDVTLLERVLSGLRKL